jgi:hypothetical protein
MKKQIISGLTDRPIENKAEMQSLNPGQGRKVVYTHKPHDYSHGRINKQAIGINHEPGLFR